MAGLGLRAAGEAGSLGFSGSLYHIFIFYLVVFLSKKISSIQKKIKQVKKGNVFFDPELERSIMFPNREDEEEDDFAL